MGLFFIMVCLLLLLLDLSILGLGETSTFRSSIMREGGGGERRYSSYRTVLYRYITFHRSGLVVNVVYLTFSGPNDGEP